MSYDNWFYGTLNLTILAAVAIFVLSFFRPLSWLGLCNGIALGTVSVPLATNKLQVGTQVGCWLWLGVGILVGLLMAETTTKNSAIPIARSACGVFGWLMFALHVLVFAAIP